MSHRSYQPALPCGNKFLQKRWDEAYYQEHKKRVSLLSLKMLSLSLSLLVKERQTNGRH